MSVRLAWAILWDCRNKTKKEGKGEEEEEKEKLCGKNF